MKVILIRSKTTDSAIFKVADTLFKAGYNVELLVWDRQNTLNCKEYPYKIKKFDLKAPYDSFWALLYLPLWWMYEFIFLMRNNYDLIHSCDLDTLWPAIFAKSLKKTKLFYTIYDFYANNLPNVKPHIITSSIRKIVSKIEKIGIGFTETLFLTDENRFEEVEGSDINNIVYIYNSPPDFYESSSEFSEDSTIFTIFYGGSIINQRGIQYVISAVEDLDDVKLIIGGMGKDQNMVERFSSGTGKIHYLGWLPTYKDVLIQTKQSDLIFRFADPKIPRTKYDSPNKLFEAMMCGKPILLNSEMGISKIVEKENCGFTVPYSDVEAIKTVIIKLKNNKDLCRDMGKNGRKAYETKYNWKIMEKRLINAYNRV